MEWRGANERKTNSEETSSVDFRDWVTIEKECTRFEKKLNVGLFFFPFDKLCTAAR